MLSPKIICEANPQQFAAQLHQAIAAEQTVLLMNHHWQRREQTQVTRLLAQACGLQVQASDPQILIPTGGTSGYIKFAIHTTQTLNASVTGFRQFFKLEQVNCFCILPLYHVSGLMQLWRSHLSGGQLIFGDYSALKQGCLPKLDPSLFCLSLVPTQLQALLQVCPQWLAQFRLILLGGAPPWPNLLTQARSHQISLALTYGMTETASHVVALKPEDFLAGKTCGGQVLPHAQLQFSEAGHISITADSLFLGYYPEPTHPKALDTDDIGYLDDMGYIHLLGRASHKIITGGENVFPGEVEGVIQSTGFVADVVVLGQTDPYWGEAVVAVVQLKPTASLDAVKKAIAKQLSRYKQPKRWIVVDSFPRNAQGKLNRTKLSQLIENHYQSS